MGALSVLMHVSAYNPDSRKVSTFEQKYPFKNPSTSGAKEQSRLSIKNMFFHDQTLSFDERLKRRDQVVKQLQEQNKNSVLNLLDESPHLIRNKEKSSSVEKLKSSSIYSTIRKHRKTKLLNHASSTQTLTNEAQRSSLYPLDNPFESSKFKIINKIEQLPQIKTYMRADTGGFTSK